MVNRTPTATRWLNRIKSVEWFGPWTKECTDIQEQFRNEKDSDYRRMIHTLRGPTPYNILYSLTQTLRPAILNSPPKPDVRRRFSDDDKVAKCGGEIVKRLIDYQLDVTDFFEVLNDAVGSASLFGMGVIRWRYEEGQDEGQSILVPEHVPFSRFCYGYGACWDEVPWVAFRHFMYPSDVREMFGDTKDVQEAIEAAAVDDDDSAGEHYGSSELNIDSYQPAGTVAVWEIWDKANKEVLFIAEDGASEPLKKVKDPLKLRGFFPCAKPLFLDVTPGKFVPVPLYRIYQDLAGELNEVSSRISRLIAVCKFRGVYDPLFTEVANIMDADETVFIPAGPDGVLGERGLDKSIWTMPIETIVNVVAELITQREQLKNIIYDVTGLADILRGVTDPRETATAQNLKQNNASGRLAQYQQKVAYFARDNMRLVGEYSAENYDIKKMQQITLLPYPTEAEKKKAQRQFEQEQAIYNSLPPEIKQELDQKGITPQQPPDDPSWEEIVDVLQSPKIRSFRIDIETNSTVAEDFDRELQDVQNLLTGVADLVGQMFPAVQAGMVPADVIKQLILVAVRRARCGTAIEDAIEAISDPAPQDQAPPIDPVQAAAAQSKAETDATKADTDRLVKAGQLELQRMNTEYKQQNEQMKLELKAQELKMKEFEIEVKRAIEDAKAKNEQMKILQASAHHDDDLAADARKTQAQFEMDREAARQDAAFRGAEFGASRADAAHSQQTEERNFEHGRQSEERNFAASREDADRAHEIAKKQANKPKGGK